jgi:hypothetical protein
MIISRSNRGSRYGPFLGQLAAEIDEDRQTLLELMRRLGVGVDHVKVIGGWAAEKVGRLKLNGRVLGYSPLSRVVEIEALTMAVRGKLALWTAMSQLAPTEPRLTAAELNHLAERARRQQDELAKHHRDAVREALGS